MTNEQIDALVELPDGVPPKTEDPDVIYLQQACCSDTAWGRGWARGVGCFDCDDDIAPTKYIRADIVRELAEEVKRLRKALEKIEDAILTNSVEGRATSKALRIAREVLDRLIKEEA